MIFHIKDIMRFFRHAMHTQFLKWSHNFSDNKFIIIKDVSDFKIKQ